MSSILVFPTQPPSESAQIAESYRKLAAAHRVQTSVPFVHTSLFHTWWHRWSERSMLRNELLWQPDSVLADAGYERKQAEREAAKPFWMA